MEPVESEKEAKTKDATLLVDNEARLLAKRLMRTSRSGALATQGGEGGMPFASLVATGTDLDGSPIILTSQLSAHTRLLEADPRCSLLLSAIGKGDPLAHPRLTLLAKARRIERGSEEERSIRRRYLMQHPKAALYVDFSDFAFWHLSIASGSLNGGFGRAYNMSQADLLLAGMDHFSDFYDFEAEAIAHMNADHSDTVARYARRLCGAQEGAWSLIGIDPEGLQLALGDTILRLPFPTPLRRPQELRPMLMQLAKQAKEES